jgi:probable phosphoglycerate mutase
VTTFFLVRHAVTSETGKRLSGWTPGVHLTEKGRAQAERTGEALAGVKFKAIYSSPLERTMETAEAIARHHKLKLRPLKTIGEVEYGGWTGRPFGQLTRTKLWKTVQRWPSEARFPNGESIREVQARAVGAIEGLGQQHPKDNVCVVSHGDVIKLIAAHYIGLHIDLFQRIVVMPGSVSVIALHDDGPRILALNNSPFSEAPAS